MEELSKEVRIVQLMKKVMNNLRHRMSSHFKEMNFTGPQGSLIGTLSRYGEMKISDLSEMLELSNSTVSGIVDRLEAQGMVERIRSKEDRRVVNIKITDKCRKITQDRFEEINMMIEQMMDKATPEELDLILEGMKTLEKVMNRQRK